MALEINIRKGCAGCLSNHSTCMKSHLVRALLEIRVPAPTDLGLQSVRRQAMGYNDVRDTPEAPVRALMKGQACQGCWSKGKDFHTRLSLGL